ncbi:MAG: MBOAT family protein [Anaerolineales bacterium]|nr:MBOAT family protein [Anaerolineales bacterium]
MAFTSYEFIVFFLIVFVCYWAVGQTRWQNLILLIASYYFYGSLQVGYAVLLGVSTVGDFWLAKRMEQNPSRKKLYVGLSLLLNVGVLAFFKYADFFMGDVVSFFASIGWASNELTLRILLPMGLSFFTLKKMSYILDVSRGTFKPVHSFVEFALYVAFFPQLAAGPIERIQKLLPQLQAARVWKAEFFYQAWPLLALGFFKKIVIANSVQILVNRVFGFNDPSGFLVLSGALGYTLQILADFSAYTDLSRGFAFLLGFNTSENFNQPYLSLTPTDFWNRWHITLSTWLRDYVFFPTRRFLLRHKANETLATLLPPVLAMLVSGFWHGAGWNFVVWGLYYGALIAAYQLLGIHGGWKPQTNLTAFCAWLSMFAFIVFGWAIFRAPSLSWLAHTLTSPFFPNQNEFILAVITITLTFVYALPLWIHASLERFAKGGWLQAGFYACAVALIVIYLNSANSDFIYFQF